MSKKAIADTFLDHYKKSQKEAVQYLGIGGARLFDVTFRTTVFAKQMVKAVNKIVDAEAKKARTETDKLHWKLIKETITTANFERLCAQRFSEVKKSAGYGGTGAGGKQQGLPFPTYGVQAWKDFNVNKMGTGTYVLGRTQGSAGITFRFTRTGKGGAGGDHQGATDQKLRKTIARIRSNVYHGWLHKHAKLVADKLKYDSQKIISNKDNIDYSRPDLLKNKPQKEGAALEKWYKAPYDMRKKENKPRQLSNTVEDETNISHQKGFEVGQQMLEWLMEQEPDVVLGYTITISDIIKQIEGMTGIKVKRRSKKTKVGGYLWDFVIEAEIEENYAGSSAGDKKSIQAKVLEAINRHIKQNNAKIGQQLVLSEGSVSPKDQIIDDVIRDIIRPLTKAGKLDRRFKINRKPKKFKPIKDTIRVKKPKRVRDKMAAGTISIQGKKTAFKVRTDKQIEKGAGRAASTTNAAELAMTKKYIQGRLPAEVRRNMGRPQLMNRTGQFSQSVKLLSLTPAANTVVAKYTYTLSGGGNSKNRTGVYSTFENSGRWPQAYNPKPLIAKSIRNLAMGRINEKLTTRRV